MFNIATAAYRSLSKPLRSLPEALPQATRALLSKWLSTL